MMGGRIEVQSTPGQGARFAFDIPLADEPLCVDPLHELLKGQTALLSSLDSPGLDALSRLLARWGMRTERCQNPDKLGDYLQSFAATPLLVLLAPWPGSIQHWLDSVRPLLQPGQRVLLLCAPEQCQQLPSPDGLRLLGLPQPLAINALRSALLELYAEPYTTELKPPVQT